MTNQWIMFLKAHKGNQLSMTQLGQLYRQSHPYVDTRSECAGKPNTSCNSGGCHWRGPAKFTNKRGTQVNRKAHCAKSASKKAPKVDEVKEWRKANLMLGNLNRSYVVRGQDIEQQDDE